MTRRRALVVFAAAACLLAALNILTYSLYRSEVQAVTATLDDRLTALGTTTARWLAGDSRDTAALDALVATNRLEDAYVLDEGLRVVIGVRTRAGAALNLLRVDQDRLLAALDGRASAGPGYSIANTRIEAAYFPIDRPHGARQVLALEAGAEYHEPATQLRTRYAITVALTLLIAIVFAVGLGVALRALEKERLAHGRAERLAVVGQMAAMVAHEVRNPLGILRGQVELARERLAADAPPRERERFADMLAEIDRLNRLTEEFLGLARDPPLEVAPVELAGLVTSIVDDVRLAGHAAGESRIATALPDTPISVPGDAGKLRQAVHNLVLNALQVGGPEVGVTIEVARDDLRARVTIADDGPGVPPELAATLFEPFVTARPGGSGLGLAIARRIVEGHGGSLVLESTPGMRGARFSIYIPAERR